MFAVLMLVSGLKLITDGFLCCEFLAQACARNVLLSATRGTEGKADISPTFRPFLTDLQAVRGVHCESTFQCFTLDCILDVRFLSLALELGGLLR